MPLEVSGVRCLALETAETHKLYIGTVDNNIWCTSLNSSLESPLVGAGGRLVKIMEVGDKESQWCKSHYKGVSGLNRLHADIHLRLLTLELEYV